MSAQVQPASPLDRLLTVTFFKNFAAAEKAESRTTLRGLLPRLVSTTRDHKDKLPWLKLARFGNTKTPRIQQDDGKWKGGSLRHDENMLGVSGIEGDYDHEILTVDEALAILRSAGLAAVIYTSPSHTEDKQRWRVLCPLSRDYDPPERDRFMARLNGLFQGSLSRESFARSQSYYYGSVNKSPSHRVEIVDGDALDLRPDLDATAVGRASEKNVTPRPASTGEAAINAGPYCQAVLRSALERVRSAADGTKHHTLRDQARLLGGFAHAGNWTRETIVSELLSVLPDSAKDRKAAQNTAEWGFDAGVSAPLDVPPPKDNVVPIRPPEPPPHDQIPDEPGPDDPIVIPAAKAHGPPALVWFDDIQPSLDALDFVEGLLIEEGAGVVYGESNAGKTFWTTDLALHVAAGMKWNGREVDQGGVVYCVLEGGIGFANRVSAWRTAKGISGIPFAARQSSLNLLDPAVDMDALIDLINEAGSTIKMPIKLIVIDTLARAFAGGNENASEDMGALVQNMDRLRRETGACVLFVHHSGKDQAKGSRGHSSLRAAIDTEIEVVASEESDEKTATVVKQRDLPKGGVFGFKLEVVELGQNRRGKPVTTCLVTPIEDVTAPTKQRRNTPMSDNTKMGLLAFDKAVTISGAYLPNTSEYPPKTYATTEDSWRREFYQLSGEKPEHARVYFNRAKSALIGGQTINQRNGFVWREKGLKTT